MTFHFNVLSCRVFILFILLTSLANTATSQIAGGLSETTRTEFGGKHYITGNVFLPNGSPVNSKITVRLASMTGGEVIASTDDRGNFIFSGLGNGNYTVTVVAGNEYETAVQHVEIALSRDSVAQSFSVTIRLDEKKRDIRKPGVVNSENAVVPKVSMDHYKKAIGLSNAGKLKEAIKELENAIASYPQFVAALTELGILHIKLGDMDNAEKSFLAALNINPEAFEPLVNHGILLVRTKRFSEAENVLQKALKLKNDSAIANYYLGRVFAGLERYTEAEKHYKIAIDIGGPTEMNEAHRMLASVYIETGDDAQAITALETYLKLVPKAPDADRLREVIQQLKGNKP